jgi:hypothetical protein
MEQVFNIVSYLIQASYWLYLNLVQLPIIDNM